MIQKSSLPLLLLGIDEGFDLDTDGHTSCGGDCADNDDGAWSAPGEVANVTVTPAAGTLLSWDDQDVAAGPGTVYDLSTGLFGPGMGLSFGTAQCLSSGGPSSLTDPRSDPAAGTAYWYLPRGRNSCGFGTYGSAPRDSGIITCP